MNCKTGMESKNQEKVNMARNFYSVEHRESVRKNATVRDNTQRGFLEAYGELCKSFGFYIKSCGGGYHKIVSVDGDEDLLDSHLNQLREQLQWEERV